MGRAWFPFIISRASLLRSPRIEHPFRARLTRPPRTITVPGRESLPHRGSPGLRESSRGFLDRQEGAMGILSDLLSLLTDDRFTANLIAAHGVIVVIVV